MGGGGGEEGPAADRFVNPMIDNRFLSSFFFFFFNSNSSTLDQGL